MTSLLDLPNEILHRIVETLLLLEQVGFDTSSQVLCAELTNLAREFFAGHGIAMYAVNIDRQEETLFLTLDRDAPMESIVSTIKQRMREQHASRVTTGSLLGGIKQYAHELQHLSIAEQSITNLQILNTSLELVDVIALAATCRYLRAIAEPILYRVGHSKADQEYGLPKYVDLLRRRPELASHVRSLCLATSRDCKVPSIVNLTADITVQSSQTHPWASRLALLCMLPQLRFLQLEYPNDDDYRKQYRTCIPWEFPRIAALQNLQEVSLISHTHWSNVQATDLVAVFMLPRIRTLYISGMSLTTVADHHDLRGPDFDRNLKSALEKSAATSNLKELWFDFSFVSSNALRFLLHLPRALEKFHISDGDALWWAESTGSSSEESDSDEAPDPDLLANTLKARDVGLAILPQRHSLKELTIRGSERDDFDLSIEGLQTFTGLEEITIQVTSLLGRGPARKLVADSLPRSIRRLQILAHGSRSREDLSWIQQLRDLISRNEDFVSLRYLGVKQWLDGTRVDEWDLFDEWTHNKSELESAGLRSGIEIGLCLVTRTRLTA